MKAKISLFGLLFLSLSLLCLQLEEKEQLSKIEQKIKAISHDEIVAKYISVSKVEDDGSMYRITIYLLFEPKNFDQVQIWTDAVCGASKRILDNKGIVRNISVWAIRPIRTSLEGEWGAIVYGRTLYDRDTNKFEFERKRTEVK
ncbi:MAG: hypothetical protein JSV96_17930 [Candidatus Aminicenantes bacterium]|nr:MAG: hypothetical protein JSV96_17930 [Candidatus Aminicenantes bacterium]